MSALQARWTEKLTGANCFTKQFTNTVKHATHKTNRHINRATHNIQGYNIRLTTSQVQEAIKQSKNNNSQGPDKLNIRHLKHIGPLGLAFLTSMFKTALNKNIIPHTWKLANIVPIPKPNKDTDKGTSYRPISLLSVIAKTLEKSLLPYITANIPNTPMQHGYTLAQLRTNKSPFLKSYLHKVDAKTHPSPLCPLCNIHTHDTHHLFNCAHIRTTLSSLDLWADPAGVTALQARWTEKLAGGPQAGTSDSPH